MPAPGAARHGVIGTASSPPIAIDLSIAAAAPGKGLKAVELLF